MLHSKYSAYFFLLIAVLSWAGNVVFGRYLHDILPPFGLSFWRWGIAVAILMLINVRHTLAFFKLLKRHFYQFFLLSFFGLVITSSFQYVALGYTSATDVGIMLSLMPIFIALFAELILKEKTSGLQKTGMLIGFIGALALISQGSLHNIRHLNFNFGDLIAVISSASWGVYTALVKKFKIPCSTWEMIQAVGLIGLILITLVLFAGGPHVVGMTFSSDLLKPDIISALIYMGIVASLISYWGWNRGVKIVGASQSGVFLYLTPIFSALFATVFLHEQLHLFHLFGGLIIFVGMYLTLKKA
jgi:drug/metabolite transporter (DMT)-like permease